MSEKTFLRAEIERLQQQVRELRDALEKINRINCPDCDSPEIAHAALAGRKDNKNET